MDKIIFYSVLLEDEVLKSFESFQDAYDYFVNYKANMNDDKTLFFVEHSLILKYKYDEVNNNE